MQFIHIIPPNEATGQLAELYARDQEAGGRETPIIAAWSLRPDVLEAWSALNGAIRSHLDERRYELVTLVAAARVKCSV